MNQLRAADNARLDGPGRERDRAHNDDDNYDDDEAYDENGAHDENGAYDDEAYDEEAYDEDEELEPLSTSDAARTALRYITELTGKEPSGIVSLEPTEDGWVVGVEVVEDRRIPSASDILGLYLAEIASDGSLLAYRRSTRYARGRGDSRSEVA